MKLLFILILALSFSSVGCSSKAKKSNKKAAKQATKKASKKVAGQLPDHDFKIYQPLETEVMIMIDSRGRAKKIPNEWAVDTSAHKPYKSNKKVAKSYKKKKVKKRMPASKKKKKYKKKKRKKRTKSR